MQTENRSLDDLARMANGALNTLSGLREEIESRVRERVERMLADMDMVPREEFDAVQAMAQKARRAGGPGGHGRRAGTAARRAGRRHGAAAAERGPSSPAREQSHGVTLVRARCMPAPVDLAAAISFWQCREVRASAGARDRRKARPAPSDERVIPVRRDHREECANGVISSPETEAPSGNPLDLVEQVAIAHEWPFQRQNDDELAAEISGHWCQYRMWFCWHPELGVMHLSCALEMKMGPANKRGQIYALLAMANEKLGSATDLWSEENLPVFRHALMLRDGVGVSSELLEDLVDIAGDRVRAVLSGLSVRDLGRQVGRRGPGGGHARDRGRSLMTELTGPLVLVGCGKMGGALLLGATPRPRAAGRLRGRAGSGSASASPRAAWRARARRGRGAARRLAAARAGVRGQAPGHGGRAARLSPPDRAGRRAVVDRRRHRDRTFRAAFGQRAPIVRAMPNTPAAIGQGVTALCANRHVSAAQRQALLGLDGGGRLMHWIDDEEQMHALTAMSGGGPAYVFLLIETWPRRASPPGCGGSTWALARARCRRRRARGQVARGAGQVLRQNDTLQPGRNYPGGARRADGGRRHPAAVRSRDRSRRRRARWPDREESHGKRARSTAPTFWRRRSG